MNSSLPPALQESLDARNLLVFCGAGLSILPPSNLPDWWGFNAQLLDAAKAQTLEGLPDLAPATVQRLEQLTLGEFAVEAFSDILVTTFAGPSYFPVLRVLDGTISNVNHKALAELAKRGVLRSIVSTNFDTLIELAFREMDVPLNVLSSAADIERVIPTPSACTLYKIHGTVEETATLVDTVNQKLRGLSPAVRGRLQRLFQQHHVLILGYSGADLAFGGDYLALRAILPEMPGITWLVRSGSQPSPRVHEIVNGVGARGALLEGRLPDIFTQLGVDIETLGAGETPNPQPATKPAEAIQAFFDRDTIGVFSTAAFCVALLARIGEDEHVQALLGALEAHPGLRGPGIPMHAGAAFRVLACDALKRVDVGRAEHWSRKELALFQGIQAFFEKEGIEPWPEVVEEWNRNRAGIWINLAHVALIHREFADADKAVAEAERYAEAAHSSDLLAGVFFNRAQIAEHREDSAEHILGLLTTAEAFARKAGHGSFLLDTYFARAKALTAVAEYDAAIAALEKVKPLVPLAGGTFGEVRLEAAGATIAAQRGDEDEARIHFETALELADRRGAVNLTVKILVQLARHLAFFQPLRPRLLEELDRRVSTVSESEISRDMHAALIGIRELLATQEVPSDPALWLNTAGMSEPEAIVRRDVCRLELAGERAERLLEDLDFLCRLAHLTDRHSRLVELATAYRLAAERAGEFRHVSRACNHLGNGYDSLGELDRSLAAYEAAIATDHELPLEDRAQLGANLALVKSRRGDVDAALALRDAIVQLVEHGLEIDALRAQINLAEHLGRLGRHQEALTELALAEKRRQKLEAPGAGEVISRLRSRLEYHAQQLEQSEEPEAGFLLNHPEEGGELSHVQIRQLRARTRTTEELANLGILAQQNGQLEEARSILTEARERYTRDDDLLGVSRCWNNLAIVALAEGHGQEAIHSSETALEIRKDVGDLWGQSLTLGELARIHFVLGEDRAAVERSRQGVALLKGRAPDKALAGALGAFALASGRLGHVAEARDAARRFLEVQRTVHLPQLAAWRPLMEQLAALEPPPQVAPPGNDDRQRLVDEALRLSRLGSCERAMELLEAVHNDTLPQEMAIVLGTKGHVLQNAGRPEEALEHYRQAAEKFRELDDLRNAAEAERQIATCLSSLSRFAEAEMQLRRLLDDLPPSPARGSVLRTLAATIKSRLFHELGATELRPIHGFKQVTLDAEILERPEVEALRQKVGEETNRLLAEVLEMPGLSDEERGVGLLNRAFGLHDLHRTEEARELLHSARTYLLRANSRYIEVCNHMLDVVEESSD